VPRGAPLAYRDHGAHRGEAVQIPVLDRPNSFAQQLFAPLPARYDRLAEVLSFGQNGRWRRTMVDHVVGADQPRLVLDVAAGTAGVSLQLAKRTGARVIGLDLTRAMLAQGARNIRAAGADGVVTLVNAGAERLPFADGSFDALTFTYLLRYVSDPQAVLAELARVVRPGGVVASLEFNVPPSAFWRFWWHGYTRLLLPLGGLVTGGRQWYAVGRFLGPSISRHYRRYPIDWTVRAWEQAGLQDVGYTVMSLGGGLVMWGTRAGG
jgi:demethylmenaquinone methyltransferase / 2-methoxy-6-polyprenyl-1,4-benzoquinol methylase